MKDGLILGTILAAISCFLFNLFVLYGGPPIKGISPRIQDLEKQIIEQQRATTVQNQHISALVNHAIHHRHSGIYGKAK